ncbi:MAG: zf-HC2 domain-containing protein [Gemmatimonadaceae bacterium]
MTTPMMNLDCDGFAEALSDYLEGDVPDGLRGAVEAHASSCASCGQVLAELKDVTACASALPMLAPSRDLWAGISERIDARVLPMEPRPVVAQPRRHTWLRPAVAAAALVVITAGITYTVTRSSLSAPVTPQVAAISPDTAKIVTGEPTATFTTTASEGPGPESAPAARVSGATRSPASRTQLVSAPAMAADAADPVFALEITKLRRIVRERRDLLDPSTVAVLEQSIAVIDGAIAQSRAALAKDPASAFLATQLNHSLEKKVELLRTAALLPART